VKELLAPEELEGKPVTFQESFLSGLSIIRRDIEPQDRSEPGHGSR
jgi:hypothetical protein